MGGFHLTPAPESYITQVIRALNEIDPDYLVPMHCSGAGFARVVQKELPDNSSCPTPAPASSSEHNSVRIVEVRRQVEGFVPQSLLPNDILDG